LRSLLGTIGDRLRAIQPSLFLGVPRVWEKMQDKILAMSKANPQTGFKLKVKDWAKASALHNAQNSLLGGTGEYPPNQVCGLLGHDFFDKKVLSTVAGRLGLDQCVFKGMFKKYFLFLIQFQFLFIDC
jgi:long-subunit acyl-CoA synthetase (AMP-forming)